MRATIQQSDTNTRPVERNAAAPRATSWVERHLLHLMLMVLGVWTLAPGRLEITAVPDDPADDKVLVCAIEGQVDYVVASDRHLTDLDVYAGISIVRPRRFLELLEYLRDR